MNKWYSFALGNADNSYIGQLEYGGENADRPYHSRIKIERNGTELTLIPDGAYPPVLKKIVLIGG